jgi:hypothetical protein
MAENETSNEPVNVSLPVVPYHSPTPTKPGRFSRWRMKPVWPLAVAATTTVVSVGGFLALVGSSVSPCLGGTRSYRLKWEQRAAEVNQAVDSAVADGAQTGARKS